MNQPMAPVKKGTASLDGPAPENRVVVAVECWRGKMAWPGKKMPAA